MNAVSPHAFASAVTAEAEAWFREAVALERDALQHFLDAAAPSIEPIVARIAAARRPIVCTGVGKSGLVAAKLAATFSSLGTPAFFLNAAEAAHGDLGAIESGNIVILLSNSGATEEILRILPLLKARHCGLVGIIGRADAPLARAVDHLILTPVEREADHIGMAPTASTTLQMAVGDALAIAVSRCRGFTRQDFLRHHPAGLLGRQLIPITSVMRHGDDMPKVPPTASIAELLRVMSAKRMGAACVTDGAGLLLGLVVDGDIRRHLLAERDLYRTSAGEIMQSAPLIIHAGATVGDALLIMRSFPDGLLVLPVVDAEGRLAGMLHAHDILQG